MEVDEYKIAKRIAALPGAQRPALLRRMAEQGLDTSILPIVPYGREAAIPLSYAQQGLWLTWRMDPASPAYNMQSAVVLTGAIDRAAFGAAIDDLAARHDILRTVFPAMTDSEAEQMLLPPPHGFLRYEDVAELPRAAGEELARGYMQDHARQPFALDNEPGWRVLLLRLDDDTHWLSLVIHHIVTDGWSASILIRDLAQLYVARRRGGDIGLQPLPIQFADYAIWQRDWLQSGELARQLAYWELRLQDSLQVLPLPLEQPRSARRDGVGGVHEFTLPATTAAGLRVLAERSGASVFITVLAVFKIVLARYSGEGDISVGSPVANRNRAETQDLIGYLTNLLVLRTQISLRLGFRELLAAVRATVIEAQDNADCPFDLLVSNFAPAREDNAHPFFQVKCTEQKEGAKADGFDDITIAAYGAEAALVHFDLSFDFTIKASGIICTLTYAADIFEPSMIVEIAEAIAATARFVIDNPDTALHEQIYGAVIAGPSMDVDSCILEGWQRNLLAQPDVLCLRQGDRQLSRAELDTRAGQLAILLRQRGVKAETRVAIHAARSCEFAIAVLAVLKAGGACVPLDPKLPAERLRYQLEDSGAALLCADDAAQALALQPGVPVLAIDASLRSNVDAGLCAASIHPDQAAYVIYTSGSTGLPKGVVVSHRALANYVQAVCERLELAPDSAPKTMAMVSTVAADLGHTMLFGALYSGCGLDLVPADVAFDPDAFADYMRRQRIDILKIVPSHLQALLDAAHPADVLPTSRLVLGGESTRWALLDRIQQLRPECRVLNHYGPTETAVGILTQPAEHALRSAASLPLGVPLANCRVHVLDAELNPVPAGVAGELYLGGVNVARGYQRRSAQTAERFIASPFESGERLYRSGDRVRLLRDGSLEFLGRSDDQVKVRGYRVELREVAHALRAQPEISAAEVIVREDDNAQQKLCGYVVAHGGATIDIDALRTELGRRLPDYMVPDAIIALQALPLTANGKIDRAALPVPTARTQTAFEAPQGSVENTLAAVWAEVLGVERVGRHDNFFALGGDSILSLKVVARARKQGLALKPKQLFEYHSLFELAQQLARDSSKSDGSPSSRSPENATPPNKIPADCTAIQPQMLTLIEIDASHIDIIERAVPGGAANIQDIYPLAPLQEGILFHHVLQADGDAYVTARLMSFDTKERLEGFIECLNRVIARHDILRTAVLWEALPEPVQVVHRHASLALQWLEPTSAATDCLVDHMHPNRYRIDVRQAPMLRAAAIHDEANDRWLLRLLIHHLIDDNTTVKQIVEEVALLQRDHAAQLPVPVPFRNFVAQARRGSTQQQREFFERMLGDVVEPTAPFGLLDVQGDGSQLAEAKRMLDDELAQAIRRQAQTLRVSAASFFHLAWALVLARTTGRADVVFGTVLFGRMQVDEHAERALGLFINTLPIRITIDRDEVGASLQRTHRVLTELLQHEHASLALAQRASGVAAGALLFTTLLNYRYGAQVMEASDPAAWQGIDVLETRERTNYPIGISVDDLGDRFQLVAQVDQSLDARLLCVHLDNALQQIVAALDGGLRTRTCELDILDHATREQLLTLGSNSRIHENTDPVHVLFERQAALQPHADAVVFGDETLSYGELNRRANRLAHMLIERGIGPEVLVGVAVARSLELMVGLLAILKAGGAYVPLDPEYPADRLAYMAEDSGIALLMTQRALRASIPNPRGVPTLELDAMDLCDQPHSHLDERNPGVAVAGENLVYTIYTSGSTGKPKGAANRHVALSHCMQWMQERYVLTTADTVLHKAAFGFDVSAWEMFWPLTSGSRLAIAQPGDHRDPARIIALIQQHRVTVINFVPAMLQAFLAHEGIEQRTGLRYIICGGEAMPAATQHEALTRLRGASLQNLYGPTEAAIHVTQWTCRDDGLTQVPIGRPISGIQTHVLAADLTLVPEGIAGELHLGGVGLGRGYLGRADLSAERFIADPFSTDGGRLYRTGDLVRWNGEGQLEYLGRIDHQIKVRGFRIELGEIEAQLLAQPEVREAVVMAQAGLAGARLVGYVAATQVVDAATLRARLGRTLPDYMVPSAIVVLDALPLNANGKVDRKALPAAEFESEQAYEAPQGQIEEKLAAIWREVLGVARVGRRDNFFELGGHSLLALKLLQHLQDRFGAAAPSLTQLIKHPEFGVQADFLRGAAQRGQGADVFVFSDTGAGVPLYCFPGTLENAASYNAAAQALAGARPMHAFVSHALTAERWREHSIDSLAQEYADHIKATVTQGRCALLGWSLGAQLAFETARKLAGSVDVVMLGLVDPIEHDFTRTQKLDQLELDRARIRIEELVASSHMREHWLRTVAGMSDAAWNHYAAVLLAGFQKISLDGPAFESMEYRQWAVLDAVRMASRYERHAVDATINLWTADVTQRGSGTFVRDWREHGRVVCEVEVVGTDHRTIVQSAEFVERLCKALAEADRC